MRLVGVVMKDSMVFKNFFAFLLLGVAFFVTHEIEGAHVREKALQIGTRFMRSFRGMLQQRPALLSSSASRFTSEPCFEQSGYRGDRNRYNARVPWLWAGLAGLGSAVLLDGYDKSGCTNRQVQDNAQDSDTAKKIVIWIRRFMGPGEDKSNYVHEVSCYINELVTELSHANKIEPIILIATKESDPIVDYIKNINNKNYRVITPSNTYFSTMVNGLIAETNALKRETQSELPVLTISYGIKMPSKDLHGFQRLVEEGLEQVNAQKNVYAYGWTIAYEGPEQEQRFVACHQEKQWCHRWDMSTFYNDGSDIGKCWYNTAALLSPEFTGLLGENSIPEWVNPGQSGKLDIVNLSTGQIYQGVSLEGLEEVSMIDVAVKENPHALFILNNRSALVSTKSEDVGKLLRKVPVGHYYCDEKLLPDFQEHLLHDFLRCSSPAFLSRHIQVIGEDFGEKSVNESEEEVSRR